LVVFKKTTISTLKVPVHIPTCALHNRKTLSCDCRFIVTYLEKFSVINNDVNSTKCYDDVWI